MEILSFITIGAIILIFAYKKISNDKRNIYTVKSSLLFAFLTKGNMLMRASRGKLNGMYYDLYVTISMGPLFGDAIAPGGAAIYRLELPFNTQGHLVGISNKNHITKEASLAFVKQSGMQEVTLEGDFHSYFKFFCAQGQQTHARYVFDPAAMQFVAEFCSHHDWEIVYDELYFTVSHGQRGDKIIKNSIEFIKQIEPAIIKEFHTKESIKRKTSYGEWRGDPMPCPVCDKPMNYHFNWHECTYGHGRLVHAQKLLGFRKGRIKKLPKINEPKPKIVKAGIKCPHCQSRMTEIQYAHNGLMIDSCPKCPYRWFDAGELNKILPIS